MQKQQDLDKALLKSTFNGHLRRTLELIDAGADVNAQDQPDFRTPLMHAVERCSVEVAQALLSTGRVDVKMVDSGERTAFILATMFRKIVKGEKRKDACRQIAAMTSYAAIGHLPDRPDCPTPRAR